MNEEARLLFSVEKIDFDVNFELLYLSIATLPPPIIEKASGKNLLLLVF